MALPTQSELLSCPCPTCGADRGQPCVNNGPWGQGESMGRAVHTERLYKQLLISKFKSH